ncbi:MAG: sulfite exporter TauE/SafE family protein [Lachnospiraceae bacterium]|jgi:uncharacterized membrane protein YfcA|nr:sulfite exporter TauE/SafE family protein [Lachnospiraceae bacterium]
MNLYQYIIFGMVSFLASAIGAVCGIGGGVLIKPILDALGVLNVAAVSFLSGCTVLSMSCYSVIKAKASGSCLVEMKTGTPLAAGAAFGGVAGKIMFQYCSRLAENKDQVGAVQALCLLIITFGTFLYTLKKDKIKTHQISNSLVCIMIGFILGIFSSFLGIGGGPINLVVLFFFFSMDTKMAAQNSLYIILFSQAASLINTLAANTVPEFGIGTLAVMVSGGILGGAAGRIINRQISADVVNKLFIGLMVMIMGVCVYNMVRFM